MKPQKQIYNNNNFPEQHAKLSAVNSANQSKLENKDLDLRSALYVQKYLARLALTERNPRFYRAPDADMIRVLARL